MLQLGTWPELSTRASAPRGFKPACFRWPCQQTSSADFVNSKELTYKTSVIIVGFICLGWYSYHDLGGTGNMEAVPTWMKKGGSPDRRVRSRKGQEPASHSQGGTAAASQVDRAARSGSGGNDTLTKLVEVLAKLAMQSSRDLAGVIGAIYHTFLRKSNDNIVETALLQAGFDYNEEAKALKEKKDRNVDGGEPVELDSLGPPFLRAMSDLALAMATAAAAVTPVGSASPAPSGAGAADMAVCLAGNPEGLKGETGTKWMHFWNQIAKFKSQADMADMVRVLRAQKLRTGNKKGWIKIQFCSPSQDLEDLFLATMKLYGFERKIGPAPRSALERDAQRLLDTIRR